MKPNLFFLSTALLFSASLLGQNPKPVMVTPTRAVTANPVMANIKLADTNSIKIKKLQDENQKQQQDLAGLKLVVVGLNNTVTALQEAVADLKTKYNQDHLELGIAKLSLKNITGFQLPVAYASFNPEKNNLGGYPQKLVTQYGISGEPVPNKNSLTLTLNHSFEQTPVIIVSIAEDHVNEPYQQGQPVGVVNYEFLPPNQIRFTWNATKPDHKVIAPFSVVVFGK